MASPLDTPIVILCGGKGERLGSLTVDLPKPMLPIAENKPFLEVLMSEIASVGFKNFILATGYKGTTIEAHFSAKKNANIQFSHEPHPLGTAGGLKLTESLIPGKQCLVMNGDSICQINYQALFESHAEFKHLVTLVAVPIDPERSDAGLLQINKDNTVTSFQEKEPGLRGYLNAGIYLMQKKVFERIPADKPCSLEADIFPELAASGDLGGFVTQGPVFDIGTPKRLEQFENMYNSPE